MNSFRKSVFSFLVVLLATTNTQAQQTFTTLDSLLSYSSQKSTTLRSGELKYNQAQKAKLAAIAGITDLNGNVSLNATDNTKLPVSLFPAEAFGGTPGTYQEVKTGIQYTNNFNQYAELKLINASGWQNLKLAKINIDATSTDNKLNQKILYENIASSYYNIITLQEQQKATQQNIAVADTIYQIVKNKFDLGLVRQQELNDAEVNLISIKETATQIDFLIKQQYIALKISCDIPETEQITIGQELVLNTVASKPTISLNQLSVSSYQLRESYSRTYYHQLQANTLPYVAAFGSNSNQQFNNEFSLFDSNTRWINSNYVGVKAVWAIPSANSIAQISKAKYDYLLAQENTAHATLQSNLAYQQLQVDYEKASSQVTSNKLILDLRADTYTKNLDNYKQGLIGLDQLLNSYNALVNSQYNYISSTVNLLLVQSKITINNQIQ